MTCRFADSELPFKLHTQIDPEYIVPVKYWAGFNVDLLVRTEDRSRYARWFSRPSEVVVEDDDTVTRLWDQEVVVDERSKLQWELEKMFER